MKFPVDLLADVSHTELERLAHNYMNNLLYSNPDAPEHLTLPDSTQVTINICSVGFIPLYGSSDKQKVLALFSPTEPLTAVALYLLDQWWPVDDILKTADPARDGAVEVETVGERIVLYILNRVVYRAREMSSEELPFLCHGEKDHAKILWSNGEAVGFYSVKPSGSFSNSFATRSYQLPVMDSIFVRRCQRGKGFGLQMLEDFVLSFKEDCLGLRYPLTKPMYKVCEKYLRQFPGDTDLLWEVESVGGPNQRTNMASKIQAMDHSVSRSLSFTEESLVITEMTEKDVVITTQIQDAESMECTVEIVVHYYYYFFKVEKYEFEKQRIV
uniref:Family with sequence similarity 169 member Aa n=1 Tax=Sander lucioperca TaxID=283035 RepID=A0A8D0AWH1_SANLU